MVEVIVEYDYTAKEPDELTIKKGDIIKDVIKKSGGWWEGILQDKKGVFPDNFVRPVDKESLTLRSRKDVSQIKQCRVVFSYSPIHEDELKLNVGDLINVIGEEEEGWWRGSLFGKEGVFPSNFVEEINNPPKPTNREDLNPSTELDSKPPKLPNKPAKQLCEVKYAYKAQNEDELTIKKGDIITLISKELADPGWWKGELNGVIGVFPDNFVVVIPNNEDKSSTEEKKYDSDNGAMKVTSQRKSLEPKTEKINSEHTLNKIEKNNNDTSHINKTPPIPGKKPIMPIKKSPSSSGAGLFSEIKKKFVDVVDGGISSKPSAPKTDSPEIKDGNVDNIFDQVERKQLLTDVRATRAKAPGRRLPRQIHKEDEPQNIPNGNVEHLLDTSDASHNTSSSSEPDEKPKLREWEKHKAPWLEEMKANQAKRTSTSPGPPGESKMKLTPTGDLKSEEKEDVVPPVEKEVVDMSKSMPPMDLSRSLSSNIKAKPAPQSEKIEDKVPVIKAKPIIPPSSSVRQALANRDPAVTNRHTISANINTKDPLPAATRIPASVSHRITSVISSSTASATTKSIYTIAQKPDKEVSKGGDQLETVSTKQYDELLDRVMKLEALVEKQNEAIEDLRNKLQVESDLRMLLQERMENYQV